MFNNFTADNIVLKFSCPAKRQDFKQNKLFQAYQVALRGLHLAALAIECAYGS
jgi:hypothetical protein